MNDKTAKIICYICKEKIPTKDWVDPKLFEVISFDEWPEKWNKHSLMITPNQGINHCCLRCYQLMRLKE